MSIEEKPSNNFIRHIIDEDLKSQKNGNRVVTRFPPEPNGFLHIGHAKSICLNFGISQSYPNAYCNLRFDDTNPSKEDVLYMDAIQADIEWLGFRWHGKVRYASDYFDQLFDFAVQLIKMNKAYVCSLSPEDMRKYRGTLTEPGKESPDRHRSAEENLKLFEGMRDGLYAEGQYVLRAKIDMNSGNINMRDPVIYRIMKHSHPMTKDKWCIYPMYDYTHCISDSLEDITHSLCTLEFEDHRPLYDWVLETLGCKSHPQQIEFARLNLNYTVTSKRKLKELVDQGFVSGWDDPRMPTIVGLRRRGFTPKAIRDFCERIGVTKKDTVIDMSYLEECVREDLGSTAPRAFCVLRPLKVVIENYPEGKTEELKAPNHPQNKDFGERTLPFSREIFIEHDDFMENAPKDFFRLSEGKEVRLRYSYIIKCTSVIKDSTGQITELRCTYDPDTLGKDPVGRKVKGIVHWLSARHAVVAEVRLYDRLFKTENPSAEEKSESNPIPYTDQINPLSLQVVANAMIEPSLQQAGEESRFQFERLGYFFRDKDSSSKSLVFNRTVTLKDSWVLKK